MKINKEVFLPLVKSYASLVSKVGIESDIFELEPPFSLGARPKLISIVNLRPVFFKSVNETSFLYQQCTYSVVHSQVNALPNIVVKAWARLGRSK